MPHGTPAPLQPSDVRPVVDADLHHILDSDGLGSGGHRAWTGTVGKEELTAGCNEIKVCEAIEAALWGAGAPRTLTRSRAVLNIGRHLLMDRRPGHRAFGGREGGCHQPDPKWARPPLKQQISALRFHRCRRPADR